MFYWLHGMWSLLISLCCSLALLQIIMLNTVVVSVVFVSVGVCGFPALNLRERNHAELNSFFRLVLIHCNSSHLWVCFTIPVMWRAGAGTTANCPVFLDFFIIHLRLSTGLLTDTPLKLYISRLYDLNVWYMCYYSEIHINKSICFFIV